MKLLYKCVLMLLSLSFPQKTHAQIESATSDGEPFIVGTIPNITAAVGKTAKFTCTVRNLNKYHVVWFHVQRNMLLTIASKVVTRIPRFLVREDNDRWTLQIRDVMREDKGAYACQVNTEPQLRELGYLDVVVPPEILDSKSSGSTVIVKENGNATLKCYAEGNPKPKISWVREDQSAIKITQRHKEYRIDNSPELHINKVSRTDMGAYLCIASNGFPPTVSKRTVLFVEFSPIVIVPNQLLSAPLGTSISLECITEAYPRAVTFWRYNGNMVMSTNKYNLREIHDKYETKVYLTINELAKTDFGQYMCNSRNSFGENGGSVELIELPPIPESEEKKHQYVKRPDRDKKESSSNSEYKSRNKYENSRGQNQLFQETTNVNSANNSSGRSRSSNGATNNMYSQNEFSGGTYDMNDRNNNNLAIFFENNAATKCVLEGSFLPTVMLVSFLLWIPLR